MNINMDKIISPNELSIEIIDRLISLCDSLPLPQQEPVDDPVIDFDKEQEFQADLEQKSKYNLKLGLFLLKARDNLANVDLDELLKSLVNNFVLVLQRLGFDEFSDQYMALLEILTPSEDPIEIEITSSEVDLDDRITMVPPKQTFVSSTSSSNDDADDRSGGDTSGGSGSTGGGASGGKGGGVDQF